jgi:hypothetical protein
MICTGTARNLEFEWPVNSWHKQTDPNDPACNQVN